MDTIGPWELLIILFVLVALFGASRLPRMARGLGEGIREFRTALHEASHPEPTDPGDPPSDPANTHAATDSSLGQAGPARPMP